MHGQYFDDDGGFNARGNARRARRWLREQGREIERLKKNRKAGRKNSFDSYDEFEDDFDEFDYDEFDADEFGSYADPDRLSSRYY